MGTYATTKVNIIGNPDYQAKILTNSLSSYLVSGLTFDIDTKNSLPNLQDLAASHSHILISTRSVIELDLEIWSLYHKWNKVDVASWKLELISVVNPGSSEEKTDIKRTEKFLHPNLKVFNYTQWVNSLQKELNSFNLRAKEIFEIYEKV